MLKKIIWFALILIVPFVVFELIFLGPGALEVARTGMCPAAPTDISPYPCTVGEYFNRMLFGGFAGIAQMMFACFWLSLVTAGTAVFYFIRRKRQPSATAANGQPL